MLMPHAAKTNAESIPKMSLKILQLITNILNQQLNIETMRLF